MIKLEVLWLRHLAFLNAVGASPSRRVDRKGKRGGTQSFFKGIPDELAKFLTVVVKGKFVRMGTQAHGVNFVIQLVSNPVLDEVFAEYATLS
jgi:hypothetical protein